MNISYDIITKTIKPNSRVLEIGCADGDLLCHIQRTLNADCRGLEISMAGVQNCMARGLSVVQGNADTDLADYPDNSFDTVISINTLQATLYPRDVLHNIARIADTAVVTIPNFAHWRNLWAMVVGGRMPVTPAIPLQWYDTPNVHFCTLRDFADLCDVLGLDIVDSVVLGQNMQRLPFSACNPIANRLGATGVFVLRKKCGIVS